MLLGRLAICQGRLVIAAVYVFVWVCLIIPKEGIRTQAIPKIAATSRTDTHPAALFVQGPIFYHGGCVC